MLPKPRFSKPILWDAAFLLTVGSFLLTAEFFCLQLRLGALFAYNLGFFCLQFELLCQQLSFFAYNRKECLRSISTDCKQRSSTVSKKAPNASKKASPLLICHSAASTKLEWPHCGGGGGVNTGRFGKIVF